MSAEGRATGVVLVVDDDDDVRDVTAFALQVLGGFTVLTAPGGAEGLAATREHRPDLVLLDVMMPGMDGPAVLRALRSDPDPVTAAVPVVLLTAKVPAATVALAGDVEGVVHKPFDPRGLVDEVRRVLGARGLGPAQTPASAR